jgi:Na+/H+ antiporter NhaA
LIAPLLRLAAASAAARTMRNAAGDIALRLALTLGAVIAGAIGVMCFSYAGLTILQRHLDPAEAWGIMGGLYAVAGLGLYLAATRRRRGI